MIKNFKMLTACIMLGAISMQAQVVQTAWTDRYDGPGNFEDVVKAMVMDDQGNIYVTGSSTGSETSFDYATIKYSPEGERQWVSRYNLPGNDALWDIPKAMAIDKMGYVYVTGMCGDPQIDGKYVAVTIKYDHDGDTVWTHRYGGPENGIDWLSPEAIAVDDKFNVFITGTADIGFAPGLQDNVVFTVKYNPYGDTLWTRKYRQPDSYSDVAYALVIDSFDNPVIAGTTERPVYPNDNHILIIKYGANGDTLWVQTYDGPDGKEDQPVAMVMDAANNIYITGKSKNAQNHFDYLTLKYDAGGNQQWVSRHDGPGEWNDEAQDIAVDMNGNSYVTGFSRGIGTWNDIATIKYNPEGDTVWVRRFNGLNDSQDGGEAIAVDQQGNVYVTGVESVPVTWGDFVTIKYDTDGNEKWIERLAGPGGYDLPVAIAVDQAGSVIITGINSGDGSAEDFLTVKYNQTGVNIEKPDNQATSGTIMLDIHPNPITTNTLISWRLQAHGHVILKIFDLMGNEVASLVNTDMPSGNHKVLFNAVDLPAGIYFMRLYIDNQTIVKKIIKL